MSAKSVLILGAKSDIAKSLAEVYADAGFLVQLACRDSQELDSFCQHLKVKYQVQAELYDLDVNNTAGISGFMDGLSCLPDVLISAIGLLGDQGQAEQDLEHCLSIVNTNYAHLIGFINQFANAFQDRGSGSIVGISSVAGDRGRKSNYIYGSAKAGFTAYLSGLRNRLESKGVHVMTVKPGFVNTAMTKDMDLPEKLTAQPYQVAEVIFKAERKQKDVIYTLWFWRWIMLIIAHIPERIFKKLSI